jgi:hypothetical protein
MPIPDELKKPIKIFFIVGNGLVWIRFCAGTALHWRGMASSSHWDSILLAVTFFFLGRSLLLDDDQSSHLMHATLAFFVTMLTVSRLS